MNLVLIYKNDFVNAICDMNVIKWIAVITTVSISKFTFVANLYLEQNGFGGAKWLVCRTTTG